MVPGQGEWRAVFAELPVPCLLIGPERLVVAVNRILAEKLGVPADDCIGRDWADLLGVGGIPDEPGPALTADLAALGGPYVVRMAPVAAGGPGSGGTIAVLQDLSAQRLVEWRLHESEEWLLAALEAARVGTWDWDVVTDEVRYVGIYGGGERKIDVKRTTGAEWSVRTHPRDVAIPAQIVRRAVEGVTDSFAYTVRMRRPSPHGEAWAAVHSRGRVVERDSSGRATRIIGVYEDAAEAMHRAQRERERDTALARSLRTTSLSALASGIAHEINQPLAALTSYLETLVRLFEQGETSPEAVAPPLQRSLALAGKASEIVRRLGRLLRREEPILEPIDVAAILAGVRESLDHEARAADVELRLADHGPLPALRGDGIQIEQALIILVRNGVEAVAASDAEERWVSVAVEIRGDRVRFIVTDGGPGIAEADAPRLFEPFFTTKPEGTGLGLMICESIAELHGGRLYLVDGDAPGACFVLELPLRRRDDFDNVE